jgi:hypothetical protein
VQTIPGKGWNVLFRLYGPLQPWYDKTWIFSLWSIFFFVPMPLSYGRAKRSIGKAWLHCSRLLLKATHGSLWKVNLTAEGYLSPVAQEERSLRGVCPGAEQLTESCLSVENPHPHRSLNARTNPGGRSALGQFFDDLNILS